MKKILLTLFILLALGLIVLPRILKENRDNLINKTLSTLVIGDRKVRIEIVETAQEQAKGLGGRETLAEDEGMLFLFNEPAEQRFWMRGMKFPLDILWIRGDEVRGITKNIPPPAPADIFSESLPTYQSNEPVDKVLEMNAGWTEKNSIKVGDRISLYDLRGMLWPSFVEMEKNRIGL